MSDEDQKITEETKEVDKTEEYLDNWKRERADFINYKKEEARRVEEIVKFANEGLALEIIDILDALEIAMAHTPKDIKEKHDDWLEGITSAIKSFTDLLGRYDIKRISVDKFDPILHEAVDIEEGGEKVQEIRAGYIMQGRVIRPTRVKIIK